MGHEDFYGRLICSCLTFASANVTPQHLSTFTANAPLRELRVNSCHVGVAVTSRRRSPDPPRTNACLRPAALYVTLNE